MPKSKGKKKRGKYDLCIRQSWVENCALPLESGAIELDIIGFRNCPDMKGEPIKMFYLTLRDLINKRLKELGCSSKTIAKSGWIQKNKGDFNV